MKKEINEALSREEMMWCQRSRVMWMKWGDRNTKFFHATTSQRQWRNSIMGLLDSNGMWQEDPRTREGIILIILSPFLSQTALQVSRLVSVPLPLNLPQT